MKIERIEETYKISQDIIHGNSKMTLSIIAHVRDGLVTIDPNDAKMNEKSFVFLNSYARVTYTVGKLITMAGKLALKKDSKK